MVKIKATDMKRIGGFIKRKRIEKNLTARRLAELVGVSDAHIIYIEKGQRGASFDIIVNILSALGETVEGMLAEIRRSRSNVEPARMASPAPIPVVSWVTAGKWREVCDVFEPGDSDEWIESDVRGRNVFALRVTGDSMDPEFKDGEIIVVNPHIEATPNDYVVVKNPRGEATFKQLKKYGQRWVLHPLNPRYEDEEVRKGDFAIIGKVVKKEKRY